jgi:hypothetical protein
MCEPSTVLGAVVVGAAIAGSPVAVDRVRKWSRSSSDKK